MNTNPLDQPSPGNNIVNRHRKLKVLTIRARRPQDVHRLFTQIMTEVTVTDRNGSSVDALLVVRDESFLLVHSEPITSQSRE